MTNKVYPIGYSAVGAEAVVGRLMSDPNVLLIDTRKSPNSWQAIWRQEQLQEKYPQQYKWAGEYLGNVNYNNGLPIRLANPTTGIRGLQMYLNEGHDLILLCECRNYHSCHRKVIVEKLLEAMPAVEVVQPEPVEAMMCLSVLQPWAWLLASGIKDIENRNWNTGYRGPVLLHAGKKLDRDCFYHDHSIYASAFDRKFGSEIANALPSWEKEYVTGAIIGSAELVNVVTADTLERSTPWFNGPYGFVMEHAYLFDDPIPYRGQLKLFPVERAIVAAQLRQTVLTVAEKGM